MDKKRGCPLGQVRKQGGGCVSIKKGMWLMETVDDAKSPPRVFDSYKDGRNYVLSLYKKNRYGVGIHEEKGKKMRETGHHPWRCLHIIEATEHWDEPNGWGGFNIGDGGYWFLPYGSEGNVGDEHRDFSKLLVKGIIEDPETRYIPGPIPKGHGDIGKRHVDNMIKHMSVSEE